MKGIPWAVMGPVLAAAIAFPAVGLRSGPGSTLELVQTIPLPGVTGRFDHFAVDLKGRRLFVAALGNNTLETIDLAAGRRLESIRGLGKPTGVVFLPDLDRVFVACGDDGALKVFEGGSLRPVKTLAGLDDADNMRSDDRTGLLYLGFGHSPLPRLARTAEPVRLLDRLPHDLLAEDRLPVDDGRHLHVRGAQVEADAAAIQVAA